MGRQSIDPLWNNLIKLAGDSHTFVTQLDELEMDHARVMLRDQAQCKRAYYRVGNRIGTWEVKMYVGGAQRVLGVFHAALGTVGPESGARWAGRFADAALVYFWKYRKYWQQPVPESQLNFSLKRVQFDLANEPDLLEALKSLENYLVRHNALPAPEDLEIQHAEEKETTARKPGTPSKLAARVVQLETDFQKFSLLLGDLTTRLEAYCKTSEIQPEIFGMKESISQINTALDAQLSRMEAYEKIKSSN